MDYRILQIFVITCYGCFVRGCVDHVHDLLTRDRTASSECGPQPNCGTGQQHVNVCNIRDLPMTLIAQLETIPSITQYMNREVVMKCNYSSTTAWVLMQWRQYVNETYSIPLVTQTTSGDAAWGENAPASFRDHVEHEKIEADDWTSFNLKIDGFKCSDEGTYICKVMTSNGDLKSQTKIEIKVHPGKPMISETSFEAAENSTFKIDCDAQVGVPKRDIRWSFKLKNNNVYQLVPRSSYTQTDTYSEDCLNRRNSRIAITMTTQLDGATYKCFIGDTADQSSYSDHVNLVLFGKSTTTVAPPTTTPSNNDETTVSSAVQTSSASAAGMVVFVIIMNLLTSAVSRS